MQPELVTAYYLCHAHWTVNPRQIEEDFRDMADMGFTAVAFSFCESEMRYSRRAFELQLALAKKCGLKRFVIPSRLGGRFAGAPFMASWWLASHPKCVVPGSESWPVACIESREFVDWITEFMRILVTDYDLDGVIWDEPKSVTQASSHPETVAKFGRPSTPDEAQESFAEFLNTLTNRCLALKPGLTFTLFVQEKDGQHFIDLASRLAGITYFGYDGRLTDLSYFHEPPVSEKRLLNVWDRMLRECASARKKSFALVENILMPASVTEEYERALDAFLGTKRVDHLSLYYYGHNNEDPERVQEITRRLMKKHL